MARDLPMTRLPCRLIAEAAQAVGKGVFRGTAAIASYACWSALPGFRRVVRAWKSRDANRKS